MGGRQPLDGEIFFGRPRLEFRALPGENPVEWRDDPCADSGRHRTWIGT